MNHAVRGRHAEREVLAELTHKPSGSIYLADDWRRRILSIPPDTYELVNLMMIVSRELVRLRADVDQLQAQVKSLRTRRQRASAASS